MTNREFLTWESWLLLEWNSPSRSDFYQMQTTLAVKRVLAKHPERILLKDEILPFGEEGENRVKKENAEELAKQAKQSWAAVLSAKLGKTIDWMTGKPKEE